MEVQKKRQRGFHLSTRKQYEPLRQELERLRGEGYAVSEVICKALEFGLPIWKTHWAQMMEFMVERDEARSKTFSESQQ